jgi:hypothetical protein
LPAAGFHVLGRSRGTHASVPRSTPRAVDAPTSRMGSSVFWTGAVKPAYSPACLTFVRATRRSPSMVSPRHSRACLTGALVRVSGRPGQAAWHGLRRTVGAWCASLASLLNSSCPDTRFRSLGRVGVATVPYEARVLDRTKEPSQIE